MSMLLLFGCVSLPLEPPKSREFIAKRPCFELEALDLETIRGMFVQPTDVVSVSPESSPVSLVQNIILSDTQGRLFYNNQFLETIGITEETFCVFPKEAITMEGIHGSVDTKSRFRPDSNVLLSLDDGFGLRISIGGKTEEVRFTPDYRKYAPFIKLAPHTKPANAGISKYPADAVRSGSDGRAGTTGSDGGHGTDGNNATLFGQKGGNGGRGGHGGDGDDGQNGKNGDTPTNGEAGGNATNGGMGGDGGNGYRGSGAGDGSAGGRGENGPDLKIVFRPIYSPFYPEEELIYAHIQATWIDINNNPYRVDKKNYIFHKGESFRFESRGGNGGQGGDGGRGGDGGHGGDGGSGGDGGNGGDGGDGGSNLAEDPKRAKGGAGGAGGDGGRGGNGGNGAKAGCGGNGGDGGRGGDGGNISVSIEGDARLYRQVVRQFQFLSIPGIGGQGGNKGANGAPGEAGAFGSGGAAGSGGAGGEGSTNGKKGSSGSQGDSGDSGKKGSRVRCEVYSGRKGKNGRGLRVGINR